MTEPRKAKEDVPAGEGFCAMDSGLAGWPTCYERVFEPKAIGLNEATRTIARIAKTLLHRPLPWVALIRGLARSREEFELIFGMTAWSGMSR